MARENSELGARFCLLLFPRPLGWQGRIVNQGRIRAVTGGYQSLGCAVRVRSVIVLMCFGLEIKCPMVSGFDLISERAKCIESD